MSNRITWQPSGDSAITNYEVARGDSGIGPWTVIATVAHNTSGANYDSSAGVFFYEDVGGDAESWYRLVAISSSGTRSAASVFSVGAVTPDPSGPIALTTGFVSYVRSVGSLPDGRFSDEELLSFADNETLLLVKAILAVREDYLVESVDVDVNPKGIRIPARALGGKLRNVALLDSNGNEINIPRVAIESLHRAVSGYYFKNNRLFIVRQPSGARVRLSYYARPGRLVLPASTQTVLAVNGTSMTVSGPSFGPSPWLSVDVVKGTAGYETVLQAATLSYSASGSEFEVTLPDTAENLGIEVGDYLCFKNTSPVIQLPEDFHAVLAQRVIVKALESIGDNDGFARASQKLAEMEAAAIDLITDRDDGEAEVISLDDDSPWLA